MTTAPATTRHGRKPATPTTSRNWRDDALCRQTDPDLFFPTGNGPTVRAQEAAAKRVCANCPVRRECLDWAIDTGQTVGVWGGLSEDERRALTGDHSRQYERCIEAQAFIEQRIADGVTYREIAGELRVGHHAVCRAVQFFRAEREGRAA